MVGGRAQLRGEKESSCRDGTLLKGWSSRVGPAATARRAEGSRAVTQGLNQDTRVEVSVPYVCAVSVLHHMCCD